MPRMALLWKLATLSLSATTVVVRFGRRANPSRLYSTRLSRIAQFQAANSLIPGSDIKNFSSG